PLFLRALITPTVAMMADRSDSHCALINVMAWTVLLLAVVLSQMHGFWPIFVIAILFAICFSSILPLTETIAVAGVRAHGLDYGRMRLWGSISFVVAGFVGGWLIDQAGGGVVVGCLVAGAAATVAFGRLLPERATAPSGK